MHTRSKGTLDKKVLNEYPEGRKKKDTKKESIPIDSDKPENPQAPPVVVSDDSSLQKRKLLQILLSRFQINQNYQKTKFPTVIQT